MTDPELLPESNSNLLKTVHTMNLSDEQRLTLADAVDKVLEDTTRRRRILKLVQESMESLRLDGKYMMFDLEATRRERDEALKL